MKLYVVQDDTQQYLYAAVIIAENEKEAKKLAKDQNISRPHIVETHDLEKGFKTLFIE